MVTGFGNAEGSAHYLGLGFFGLYDERSCFIAGHIKESFAFQFDEADLLVKRGIITDRSASVEGDGSAVGQ